jgi:ankyrin repeat protein
MYGHKEIVRMLLAMDGIDFNCEARDGWTPLLRAARDGNREIVEMLLVMTGIVILTLWKLNIVRHR